MISLLSRLLSGRRNLFRKSAVERDLNDELESFVDLKTARKVRDGMEPKDARRAAVMELGGVEQVKEQVREGRAGYSVENWLRDLRFALRTLGRAPAFSLSVIGVLGLGIGSTALMFTLVNSLLLAGPPYQNADRLYTLWGKLPQESRVSFSPNEFMAWREQTEVFDGLGAYTGTGFTITGQGEPSFAFGQAMTPSVLQMLGVRPSLGRSFLETEGEAGRDRVVLLSDRLWREKFGARPEVLGQSVLLNSEPHTIVGVMPPGFDFPRHDVQLWVPAALQGAFLQANADAHMLRVLARARPGVSEERIRAECDVIGARLRPADAAQTRSFYALGLKELLIGRLREPLWILLGAVGLLFLIACANVANLMLARASARQSEMAMRAALGASRPRLLAQLLTESALLAILGGVAGLALALWGLDLLQWAAAENLPELRHARLDWWAMGFVFLLASCAGLLFGLAPALAATRSNLQASLQGSNRTSGGARTERSRQFLVFAEVALAALLLISSALMLRSFAALLQTDPGFRAQNVIVANTAVSEERYPDAPAMLQFYRQALANVRALPGVAASGMITHLPFGGNDWGNGFEVEGQPAAAGAEPTCQIRPSSPGYFAAMGIPMREGREFTERDEANAPRVAIVNELFARRFWPNGSALGQRVRFGKEWLSIVGVSGNVKTAALERDFEPEIYAPYPQIPAEVLNFVGRELNFVVRSSAPNALAPSLPTALHALDPDLVVKLDRMESLVGDSMAEPRFRTWLIALFSLFALLLACLGIYGVIAFLVTQRTREIGIRMALGATRGSVVALVLSRTLKLAAMGVAAGVIAAFFLSRLLAGLLFGITTRDPLTFFLVPLTLLAIGLLAGYLPARRAARIDPIRALRYE